MASKNNTSNDLLGGLTEDGAADEVIDLLDGLTEDEGEPWGNPDETEVGSGVQGTVIRRYTTSSDYTPDPIPVLVIETPAGEKVRITGYQSILRNEIEAANPQIGDTFAAKYFGKKDGKKGNTYHLYKVAVRPGARPAAAATSGKPPF